MLGFLIGFTACAALTAMFPDMPDRFRAWFDGALERLRGAWARRGTGGGQ